MGTDRRTNGTPPLRAGVGLAALVVGIIGMTREDGSWGLPVEWPLVVIGAGLLGTALLRAAPSRAPAPAADRDPPVVLAAPFVGDWMVLNGPGSAVPSHGTHFLAQTFAVDLLPATDRTPDGAGPSLRRGVAAGSSRARHVTGHFPRPDRFDGFGAELTAPVDGTVVSIVQDCRDHRARIGIPGAAVLVLEAPVRSMSRRLMVGNYLVIRSDPATYVLMAHLQRGSVRVAVGDHVRTRQVVARCGNSGNTSQPHLHLQAMDGPDPRSAAGLPFRVRTADAVVQIPRNGETFSGPPR